MEETFNKETHMLQTKAASGFVSLKDNETYIKDDNASTTSFWDHKLQKKQHNISLTTFQMRSHTSAGHNATQCDGFIFTGRALFNILIYTYILRSLSATPPPCSVALSLPSLLCFALLLVSIASPQTCMNMTLKRRVGVSFLFFII